MGVFLWNLPSNIICIVLKGSPGLDHVLLNSYYFFILEGCCFCSRWLLRFIIDCLHPFFCIKLQVPPITGTQRSFTSCYSEALCSQSYTSACSLVRDGTLRVLPNSSFLPSSQRIWEQLVSQWKLLIQHKVSSEKKVLPLLLLAHPFPYPWKAAVEALAQCTTAKYLYCPPLLPLGWRSPWHNPSRTSSCAFTTRPFSAETSLHDNMLQARAHLLYLLVLDRIVLSFFARLAKNWTIT